VVAVSDIGDDVRLASNGYAVRRASGGAMRTAW